MKNLIITNVKHRKGNTTDAYTAKISYKTTNMNVTYNCQNGDIVIDKWYLLSEDELTSLNAELAVFFAQQIA